MANEQNTPSITYQLIQSQFTGFEIAEAHGILVALACVNRMDVYQDWLAEVEALADHSQELNTEILKILFDKTMDELLSKDLALSLLIPDEDDAFKRLEGFVDWCQGFLYGLGISGIGMADLDEDGAAFLEHLAAFANLEPEGLREEIESEDEGLALEELVEFVRMSSLLIFYHFREAETVH